MLQDYRGVAAMGGANSNQYKRICYAYDLISGKVNGVDYQPGEADVFYHRYSYDAENRLVEVKTSRDSIVWERDAAYSYYKHGPLARMVFGQLQPQGLDYSYTLQGWLKGVNIGNLLGGNGDNTGASCTANTALDDATVSSRPVINAPVQYTARGTISFIDEFTSKDNDDFETQLNNSLAVCSPAGGTAGTGHPGGAEGYPVGRDAYSFSLHYYPGDYKPIGSIDPVTGILEALPGQAAPLFNGNIAAMAVNIPKLGDPQVYNKVYNYHYDQLNRLSQMDAFNGLNTGNTTFTPIQLDDYKEKVSYDPSGNIMTYLRRGTTDGGKQRGMDSLSYDYYPTTNQLKHIGDNAAYSGNYTEDIDNQTDAANYTYDAIGNLKTDIASSITGTGVEWTVYGKIAAITKASSTMTYTYDASGNRITKTVGNVTTVYVRDAQGNVMSVYQKTGSNPLQQQEIHLYGSSRLGILNALTVAPISVSMGPDYGTSLLSTFTRGEKNYELSNHLGNVLAAISDKKIAVSSGGSSSLIDHYEADVTSAQDYYPFGMQMPGRTYSSGSYRYGFNGKENDNEVKGVGNQQDYGMRIYDPRSGRFLSVDPITGKYPGLTPYQYASDNPIMNIDIDGLEGIWYYIKHGDLMGALNSVTWNDVNEGAETFNRNVNPVGIAYYNGYQLVTGRDASTGQEAPRVDALGNLVIAGIFHQAVVRAAAPSAVTVLERQMAENTAARSGKAATNAHNNNSGSAESNTAKTTTAPASSEGNTFTSSGASAPVNIIETSLGKNELAALKIKVQNVFKGVDKTHLDAAIGDMAGKPVVKWGKAWDHLNDISIHLRGLNRQIKRLSSMINENKFTGVVLKEATELRSSLQKQYDSYLGALQRAANKYGETIDIKSKD
ncbi:RHS repeat domain-containing protein [Flavitalea flava]